MAVQVPQGHSFIPLLLLNFSMKPFAPAVSFIVRLYYSRLTNSEDRKSAVRQGVLIQSQKNVKQKTKK